MVTSSPFPFSSPEDRPNRRGFLKAAAAVATAGLGLAGPTSARGIGPFVHTDDKAGTRPPILGEGAHRFEVTHGWGHLPDSIRWGETHGVTIDPEGFIYITHRSTEAEPMDAIVVFDPQGRFVRSFGREFHGGGHGIDLRIESGQPFLYLCDMTRGQVVKSDLKGEVVWRKAAPPECPMYDRPEAKFVPTNVAFDPDGGFLVADGYGSNLIHRYDARGCHRGWFGGTGTEPDRFRTPHGLWVDQRPGRVAVGGEDGPVLVVADRANARLQWFTLEGKWLAVGNNLVSFPAHFDIDPLNDLMVIPDLHARVTLMDRSNQVVTHLGDDPEWTKTVLDGFRVRRQPETWRPGRFVHPHDACFDHDGNLVVVEWVATGRVNFLRKLA